LEPCLVEAIDEPFELRGDRCRVLGQALERGIGETLQDRPRCVSGTEWLTKPTAPGRPRSLDAASAGSARDGNISISVDRRDPPRLATFNGHGDDVLGVNGKQDGATLVSMGYEGDLKVWESH
jgi:hypothetical protein